MFSTHILSDVERICDHIAVLHKGKLALSGSLSEIKAAHKRESLEIEFISKEDRDKFIATSEIAQLLPQVGEMDTKVVIHTSKLKKVEEVVIDTLAEKKLLPRKLEVQEPTLESLFMEVVK
jgi:ABC-2 type transport system ATP-binding protein